MGYDKLAERYLDKAFPDTRQGISVKELQARGLSTEMYARAMDVTRQLTRDGVLPTQDQVVVELRRQMQAARRRGI